MTKMSATRAALAHASLCGVSAWSILVHGMSILAVHLEASGYGKTSSREIAVANTLGWDTEDDAERIAPIAAEVQAFLDNNDVLGEF